MSQVENLCLHIFQFAQRNENKSFKLPSNHLMRKKKCFHIERLFLTITCHRPIYGTFGQNFLFQFIEGSQKKFLWASRLWVGRRKEPISGYVMKNDEKNYSAANGLIKSSLNIDKYKKHFPVRMHWFVTTHIRSHKTRAKTITSYLN